MTLVEQKSKSVIILNTCHKTDKAIFEKLDELFSATLSDSLNQSHFIMVKNSLISMI